MISSALLSFATLTAAGTQPVSTPGQEAQGLEAPIAAPEVRSGDEAGVRAAVEDYVLGVYDAEPERIQRSVHAELDKLGFWRRSAEDEYQSSPMTQQQLVELSARWNADGSRANENSPREITVLGVLPEIACAALRAEWGTDLFHLEKIDGKWQIRHVLWQSPVLEGVEVPATEDKELLRAGLDYVEAFYEVKPEFIDRSVHRELRKYGRYVPEAGAPSQPAVMDFAGLRRLAERLHANQSPAADAPKVVEVLFALDQVALLRIVGHWGIDFVNVARFDDQWQIRQVIWQSHPVGERAEESRQSVALNDCCPFSDRPIQADSLSEYRGVVIGFCNPGCAGKFADCPERYLHQIAEWTGR